MERNLSEIAYIEYVRDQAWRRAFLLEKKRKNGLVLDVGCGPGPSWSLLKGMHIIGIDITFNDVTILRAKQFGVALIVCDAHHLPLKDKCCTIIICQEILEHLALKEMYRVLNTKGLLFIDVPCLLDKITVPALTPLVKFFESTIEVAFQLKMDNKRPSGTRPNHEDLGVVRRLSKILDSLPTAYFRMLCKRLLHLLLTVRYCMREHRNKWAWSWINVIRNQGFVIETVRPCVIMYPLAVFCKSYPSLIPIEGRLSRKPSLTYLGQLLCIIAKRP